MNQNVNRKSGNEDVTVMLIERMKQEIEKTKEKIVFRLVDREVFGRGLDDLVSVDAGNGFSLIFAVDFGDCYMYISYEISEELGCTEEDLLQLSMVNTPRINPATFQDMTSLMVKMFNDFEEVLPGEAACSAEEFLKEFEAPLLDELTEVDRNADLYILSNKASCNGAASIYYPGVKKKIAELLDSEYYVLPCSRHEVLILPCSSSDSAEVLKGIVREANRECLKEDEVLSDTVLRYDRKLDALVKA